MPDSLVSNSAITRFAEQGANLLRAAYEQGRADGVRDFIATVNGYAPVGRVKKLRDKGAAARVRSALSDEPRAVGEIARIANYDLRNCYSMLRVMAHRGEARCVARGMYALPLAKAEG